VEDGAQEEAAEQQLADPAAGGLSAVSGTLEFGRYALHLGRGDGAVVDLLAKQDMPQPRAALRTADRLPPRAYFAGRDGERCALLSSILAYPPRPVAITGPSGIGKSTLSIEIAHDADVTQAYPDGVLYLRAARRSGDDILQHVFGALFTGGRPLRPTTEQLLTALCDKRVLLILDDVDGTRDDLDAIADALPKGSVVAASTATVAARRYVRLSLGPLSPQAARDLLAQEIGREQFARERSAVDAIGESLAGDPRRLSQAAALAREHGTSFVELSGAIGPGTSDETFRAYVLGFLSESERSVLAAVSALAGAPADTAFVEGITGLPDAGPIVRRLVRLKLLAEIEDDRVVAAFDCLAGGAERKPWLDKTVLYLARWFKTPGAKTRAAMERIEPALTAIGFAATAGELAHGYQLVSVSWAFGRACALCSQWGLALSILEAGADVARHLRDKDGEARCNDLRGRLLLLSGKADRARIYLTLACDVWVSSRPTDALKTAANYHTVTGESLVPIAASSAKAKHGAERKASPAAKPAPRAAEDRAKPFAAAAAQNAVADAAESQPRRAGYFWLIGIGVLVLATASVWFSSASAGLVRAQDGSLCYTVTRAARAQLGWQRRDGDE
jgi:hypothetical protein